MDPDRPRLIALAERALAAEHDVVPDSVLYEWATTTATGSSPSPCTTTSPLPPAKSTGISTSSDAQLPLARPASAGSD